MGKENDYLLKDREAEGVVKVAYNLLEYTADRGEVVKFIKGNRIPSTIFEFPESGTDMQVTFVLFGVEVDENQIRREDTLDGFVRLKFSNLKSGEPSGEYILSVKRGGVRDSLRIWQDPKYANGVLSAGITFSYKPAVLTIGGHSITSIGSPVTMSPHMVDTSIPYNHIIYPTKVYLISLSEGLGVNFPGKPYNYAFIKDCITLETQ